MSQTGVTVVYCTVPDEAVGRKIASVLVGEKLAACVSILPGVESHYIWEGKVECGQELLLMIKTSLERYSDLEHRVLELHPFECPEIISVPVDRGFQRYFDWVHENVKIDGEIA